MADAITIKALQDASLDAKSLEEVVNGDEAKQVTTRKGETYPSVKKAIKQMFENGALPATPFATKALMTASALVDGDYAQVTDDTVNNGLYIKEGGAWVKSEYDPLEQAKKYTDVVKADVSKKISNDDNLRQLFKLVDVQGNTVGYVGLDGSLNLTGLAESVQDSISNLQEFSEETTRLLTKNTGSKLLNLSDSEGNVYASFNDKAQLILSGMDKSVQETLSATSVDQSVGYRIIDEKFNVTPLAYPYLMNLMTTGKVVAPMPFEYIPLTWIPDNSIINLKITQPENHIVLDTFYDPKDKGRVVHPTVFQCRETVAGYKYIMGINPYYKSTEKWENPAIYGSNDLQKFDLISKFPLVDKPVIQEGRATTHTYNSDVFFTYDIHTGELLCGWREVVTTSTGLLENTLKAKRTKNLIDWGEVEVLFEGGTEFYALSPSIVYNFDDECYDLYTIEAKSTGTRNPIRKISTKSLQKPEWFGATLVYPDLPNFTPWHVDVRYVGSKLMAIMHKYDGSSGNLWVGISSDNGLTWEWADSGLLTGSFIKPYKGSVIPVFTDKNSYHLHYVWTTSSFDPDIDKQMILFSQPTTTINI